MRKSLVLFCLLPCGEVQARNLTPHDLVMLDRISDPHVSPDSTQVAYDVRSSDYDANKGMHLIWMVCAACADPKPRAVATKQGGATNPRWAPDGSALYFLSSRTGTAQVFRGGLGGDGKEAAPHPA